MRRGSGAAVWLGPLRERNFALLFSARVASLFGDQIAPIAVAFGVLGLTGSASDLGLVLAARAVPFASLMLVGGVLGDRVPRRRLMIASDCVSCVAQALSGMLLLAWHGTLWELGALQAAGGASSAFFYPAVNGLVTEVVAPAQLQRANALVRLSRSTASLAGAAAAAALVAAAGPGAALLADSATFLLSAAFLSQVRVPDTVRVATSAIVSELAAGWHEFRRRTWLWVITLHFTVIQLAVVAPMQVLGPLVVRQSLGGATAWAGILGAGAAGAIVGGVLALRLQPQRPMYVAYLMLWIDGAPLALLAQRSPAWVIAIAAAFGGGQFAFSGAMWDTAVQANLPRQYLSRTIAWTYTGTLVSLPIGLAVVGPLSDALGLKTTLWGGALLMLASSAAVFAVPSVRALQRPS
jgi:MFS family permease